MKRYFCVTVWIGFGDYLNQVIKLDFRRELGRFHFVLSRVATANRHNSLNGG